MADELSLDALAIAEKQARIDRALAEVPPAAVPPPALKIDRNEEYHKPRHHDDFYEEVDLDQMDLDEDTGIYTYNCPCGDKFTITLAELCRGESIAHCPSCTLILKVLYDPEDFLTDEDEED